MLINTDVVVIGAGLFGSIIAKELRETGKEVLVLDCEKKRAASKVAGCLIKPFGHTKLFPCGGLRYALNFLDRHYTLRVVKFQTEKPEKPMLYVRNTDVLLGHDYTVMVKTIDFARLGDGYRILCDDEDGDEHVFRAKTVVVCAGLWSNRLVPIYETKVLGSVAVLNRDATIVPKKKAIHYNLYPRSINRGDGAWVSGEELLKIKNWNQARRQEAFEKYTKFAGMPEENSELLFGYCSRVKHEKPCLLKEIQPHLWVATGGGTNSTILAAYAARHIAKKER
jgi:hypothetical protein